MNEIIAVYCHRLASFFIAISLYISLIFERDQQKGALKIIIAGWNYLVKAVALLLKNISWKWS